MAEHIGSSKVSETEWRILHLSLFVIIILALFLQFTIDQLYSLLAVVFILVVAIGNMIFLYTRSKK